MYAVFVMSWVDNFIHASVLFRYSGNFVYPEISTGTDISGLTRHHCISKFHLHVWLSGCLSVCLCISHLVYSAEWPQFSELRWHTGWGWTFCSRPATATVGRWTGNHRPCASTPRLAKTTSCQSHQIAWHKTKENSMPGIIYGNKMFSKCVTRTIITIIK